MRKSKKDIYADFDKWYAPNKVYASMFEAYLAGYELGRDDSTPPSIMERIVQKRMEYEMAHTLQPTRVYVGEEEFAELIDFSPWPTPGPLMVLGLVAVEVKRDAYLSVGP